MHIAPHDNQNNPIVDTDDELVPLNYFNIVKLKMGEAFNYQVPGYETCIVPATGTVDVEIEGISLLNWAIEPLTFGTASQRVSTFLLALKLLLYASQLAQKLL